MGAVILLLGACSIGSDAGEDFVAGDAGHGENWANIAFLRTDMFHGSKVRDISAASGAADSEISVALCADCHGLDLDGGISRVSCLSCHHGPDGVIRRPNHPIEWLAARDDSVHFHGVYGSDFPTACAGFCHGDDLTGGIGPSCFDCHDTGELADILQDLAEATQRP